MTAAKGALPNVIILGAEKCGTSSLHYYLDLHPEIAMSEMKELDFFTSSGNWHRGVDWYRSQFSADARIRGEASPHYARYPMERGVPGRMHSVVPDAKLIYLVRNPIERLVSQYVHFVARHDEDQTLEEAVADMEGSRYVATSQYAKQLEQFLPYYPMSRVLVIAQEKFLRERCATLRSVFRFLEVDPSFDTPKFDVLRLTRRDQRKKTRLGRLLAPVARIPFTQRLPRDLRWRLENLPYYPFSKRVRRPQLDTRLREKLARFFEEDLARFRKLTGVEISA